MPKNSELDRLKAGQDRAFQFQQTAYQEMKRAGDHCSGIKTELDRAWERLSASRDRMNAAYDSNQSAWQDYKNRHEALSNRITLLKSEADRAYNQMSAAFDRASNAYNYGDKASAPGYSAEGHRYKAELAGLNAQVKSLCNESKSLRRPDTGFESYKREYDTAKAEHQRILQRFNLAKAEQQNAKAKFEQARTAHTKAKEAFQKLLAQVKAENAKRKDSDRDLAQKAGVPYRYLNEVKVRRESDGSVNFYFGGIGEKDGLWHGHIATDRYGKVTYTRLPMESHGADKFTDTQERMQRIGQLSMKADYFRRLALEKANAQSGRNIWQENNCEFRVKQGWSRDYERPTTDIIIYVKGEHGHHHSVIDDQGNFLINEWRNK